MDIDRVRYFHVFSQSGSLVRAAEVLNISQPALSKALKLLEYEVGEKLLEPYGRGLRLTDSGRRFHRATETLLQEWITLPQKLKGAAPKSTFKLGSFEVFTTYFLNRLIDQSGMEQLEVHELEPGRLENAIADSTVDVGITYVPIPKGGVEFVETGKIMMGVFGSAKFKGATFAELPFVVPLSPLEGMPSKVMGLDGWPDHKIPRNVRYRVTMMESALELCRRGYAVAYLPKFIAELHNETQKLEFQLKEIDGPLPTKDRRQSVYLVRRQSGLDTAFERRIAKSLRSLR